MKAEDRKPWPRISLEENGSQALAEIISGSEESENRSPMTSLPDVRQTTDFYFTAEERRLLGDAGFAPFIPCAFIRFKSEKIENALFRSKIQISKSGRFYPLLWRILVYKGDTLETLCEYGREMTFFSLRDALDWLGAFSGQRSFPVPPEA